MFDYASVNQYYEDASSYRFIKDVQVPRLCLNALDDPIANPSCISYNEIKANLNIVLATTEHGGHLGWFENTNNPTRWMVKPLAEFIVAMFQVKPKKKYSTADFLNLVTFNCFSGI
jgi:predicted alpha/beta-fold hydrolase